MTTPTLLDRITAALKETAELTNQPGVTFDADKHELIGTLSCPEQHLHCLACELGEQMKAAHDVYMAAPRNSTTEQIAHNDLAKLHGHHSLIQTLIGASVTERLNLYTCNFSGIVILENSQIGGVVATHDGVLALLENLFGEGVVMVAQVAPKNERGRPN